MPYSHLLPFEDGQERAKGYRGIATIGAQAISARARSKLSPKSKTKKKETNQMM